MPLSLHHIDAFTDRPFAGNPLAVFPDARGLSGAQMQRIARELNLSETVFVLPAETPAGTRRVRIFTPGREVPFAGHPTVGTAFFLVASGLVVMRYVDLYWFLGPSFSPGALAFHPLNLLTMIAIGGIWYWAFVGQLEDRALLAFNDPLLVGELGA